MPPSVPDKIPCHTAKDLRYALDPLRSLIEQPETEENWDKISRALQTIAALTRGGAAELDSEYVKEIRTFSSLILNSMNSERTRLANIAVDLFTVIAPPLGSGFEPLIGVFVPTLIRLLGRTNKVFVSRATAGLRAIISNCPHPRILVELRCMATDKSASLRVLVATAVLQCMNEWDWSVPSLAAKAGDVETVIRALGTDSNVDARKIARQIFDLYKQIFPDRVDSFLEPLTPVIKRYLDIKSKSSHESGPTSRKPAPVPAPKFKAAPAPAPAPAPPVQQVVEQPQEEPARPKMTRVGSSRAGPSRAPVGSSHIPSASIHSRVVSGPERITTHLAREHGTETAVSSGPMRAALPSGVHAGPVARSVSASGPSRMRVEAPAPYSAAPSVTDSQSSYPGPPPEPTRRFRPARAPMDPSQMPQRVAIPPPAPKPTLEPRKIDGPSRVNVGAGTRSVSGPVAVPPTRVVSTSARAEHELKTSMTAPVLPASTNEPQIQSAPVSASSSTSGPIQTVTIPEPSAIGASIPSPASVPIPASAPTSRPASAIPPDSRPGSAMSIATSRAQPIGASTSTETPAATAAPPKPTLTSSKSAPITTKVSALIKRGNPYAPPPFVPKRAPASGGVGAGTASQMARQREAIAAREAREKKESEEAAKKAKREAGQKKETTKANEAKETNRKEKEKASSRPRPASSQASSSRNAPAAPRKQAALSRMKPPGGPPKVDIQEIEPEMVAAVCAPLPGSPTPPEVRAVPLPPSPTGQQVESTEPVEVEEMAVDDVVEADAAMEPAVQEPIVEETTPVESQEPAVPATSTEEAAPATKPAREVIEISDDEDMDSSEQANTGMVEVEASTVAEPTAQTPQRTVQVSLIDQTPAPTGTTPTAPPTGFAFHPQLAHLMALPPQPLQEAEDFLVDLSSPPPKERSVDKEAPNRPALGDRGNTHTYLSQFTQDLMTLSGL